MSRGVTDRKVCMRRISEVLGCEAWMDGGCGPAGHLPDQWLWWGLQVAHGAGCREAEEEPRSGGGRTTPGLREDHTAPPRATEPRATVARCQPHLITSQQTPLTRESGKDIFQFHLVISCDKSVEPSAAIKVMVNYG